MAQDEHFVSSSNSAGSGGGGGGGGGGGAAGGAGGVSSNSRSKTPKQKKIPQRGLGVAQLEKLRIEAQRKKEALQAANALDNSACGPGNDSLHGPIAASPSPVTFLPPNSLYRSIGPPGSAQVTKPSSDGGGDETRLKGMSDWSRLWSGEHNNIRDSEGGMEKQRAVGDHAGFTLGGPQVNVNLQFELGGPIFPFPAGGPQRPPQFHRPPPPPPPPTVNVSSTISPPPVSGSEIEEPPSIQNVRGNNYAPPWHDDEKIFLGVKRSYPFSLEGPFAPSFLGSNFHPTYGFSRSKSDEVASCSNEPRNKYPRDGTSNLTTSEQNPSEDVRLDRDFLSLAPPIASYSPLSNFQNKHQPSDFLGHHQGMSSQDNLKSRQSHHPGSSSSKEQTFSFFPIQSQTEHSRNGNGDKGEKLDLNLKL